MSFVSRGFRGKRRDEGPSGRVPPGQYLVDDFPVLSAGPTPRTPLEEWDFVVTGAVAEPKRWSWEEFQALPSETVTKDIHCVTKWSKLDTVWEGVSVDTLLEDVVQADPVPVRVELRPLGHAADVHRPVARRECGELLPAPSDRCLDQAGHGELPGVERHLGSRPGGEDRKALGQVLARRQPAGRLTGVARAPHEAT